jgi:pimeloyl-ACP methyl ester carboxylesterase
MRSQRTIQWLLVLSLVAACGDAVDGEGGGLPEGEGQGEQATAEVGSSGDGPGTEAPAEPPPVCEGATRWIYEPLGDQGLPTIPDDVHTLTDEASGTGRRVVLDPVHDAWLADQEDAVSAIYRSLEGLEGWGVTAPIVMRFSGPLGELPTWQVSMDTEAVLLLRWDGAQVTRHPFEILMVEDGTTAVIWPLGVLEPSTEYALLVTSELTDAEGDCVAAGATFRGILEGTASAPALARASERLTAFIGAAGLFPEEISAGVTFTTQRTTDLSETVAANITTQSYEWSEQPICEVEEGLKRCERRFIAQDYRDAEGFMTAEPQAPWELIVSMWMPAQGTGPMPTLLMGHGINSSRNMGHGVANAVRDLGLIVVAVDAIGHGDHPTNAESEGFTGMMSFLGIDMVNLRVDGRVLRDNLRQSTADRLQLLELLVADGDLDGDGLDDVDEDRMGYVGISLGGIMGSEILALSERLDVAVLITAAARMTSIFAYASNMAIMMDVMRELAGSEGGAWQLISAIQGAIDPGDPMAYAPHVIGDRLNDGAAPHVLVTMAVGDAIVPNEGTRALAQGLGIEVMHPVIEDMGLAPLAALDQPVTGNLVWSQRPTTGALFQFDRVTSGDTVAPAAHDNMTYSAESVYQLRHFLSTWLAPGTSLTGAPEIVDPYPIIGTPELAP